MFCVQSFCNILIIELLLSVLNQCTSLLIYLHVVHSLEQTLISPKKLLQYVSDLVALRLPAGIFMGSFFVISYGLELLHFSVDLFQWIYHSLCFCHLSLYFIGMFIPFSIAITFPAVMQSQTIHRRENLLQTTHLLY